MTPRRIAIIAAMIVVMAAIVFVLSSGGLPGSTFRYDPAAAVHKNFDGNKALAHAQALVDIGPRPSGSEAIEKQRVLIIDELKKVGWVTRRVAFTDDTSRGPIEFVNLHARIGDDEKAAFNKRAEVLACSHYDTKYMPGIDFVGANDGASSTGLLIEMARVLQANKDLAGRIELVFFDGEEAIKSYQVDGLHGSKYLAKQLRTLPAKQRPYAVIFDMIGDKNLNIGIPSNTDPVLSKAVITASEELGTRKHFSLRDTPITDDHMPLHEIGMRVTNLIDLDFAPYWHTSADTMKRITADSIEISGQTGLLFIEKYLLGGEGL